MRVARTSRRQQNGQALERINYPATIEGLIHGLGPLVTPEVVALMKALQVDPRHLPPAIPAQTTRLLIEGMARTIYPSLSLDEGQRALGVQFIRGWQGTLLGAAASSLLRLIGPHRTLGRLDRAFRTTDNYSRAHAELLGPREARLTVADCNDLPMYWVGLMVGGLEMLGLKGAVEVVTHEGRLLVLRLTWQ